MAWNPLDAVPGWALATFAYLIAALAAGRWGLRTQDPGQHWTEHLGDLRKRVMVAGGSLLAVALLLFSVRMEGGIPRPALHDSLASQAFTLMVDDLLPEGVQLVVVRPIDGFLAQMTLAMGIAALVTAPVWVTQLAGFVTPALRPHERRAVRDAVAPVIALFALGAAFAYLYVIPFLLKTLYGYGTALDAQPLLQVSEFIGFTVGLMAIMGLAFQTPVVMYALTKAGLVEPIVWRKGWRIAAMAILLVSALVTDPTVVSQLMVAAPLMFLYVVGVVACQTIRPASR